ncbi:MAG: ATP-binding protein [Cyclobacteriaceae bacterium]
MSKLSLSKTLEERVKELSCLYEISKIAQQAANSLDDTLAKIVQVIPNGWQHPVEMDACIQLDDQLIGNSNITEYYQEVLLLIAGKERGKLAVFYKNPNIKKTKSLFLVEEKNLITQLGIEVAGIIEKYEQREREKLIESRLRHADRLNVLGELTAGIAHELNTPLGNILGFAQLLLNATLDRSQRNDLKKIIRSAKHAGEIVKRLMYFSCEMPTKLKASNINELIKENLDLLKIQLRENNASVDLKLSTNLPEVRIDIVQFSQVLFNLVLNAIKAMPNGGKICVSTKEDKGKVVLTVSDTGVGIDQKNLLKIFDPFFTTRPTGEGTGLGLAVVHGIVQKHGGEIQVKSIPGKGTEFTITLRAGT